MSETVLSALEERYDGTIAPRFDDAQRLCGVADALEAGDEVFVGHRKETVTVQTRGVLSGNSLQGKDYPYYTVWFVGNGTRYLFRYSHSGEFWPNLYTSSEIHYAHEDHPRREAKWMPNHDARPEGVFRLWPAVVDEAGELADWVLSRAIDRG